MRKLLVIAPAAMVLTAVAAPAAVVTVPFEASFAGGPALYIFGGTSTIAFTAGDLASYDTAAVSTGGSTQIASLGAPFYDPARPTSYFTDRGGSIGPDTLAQFVGYTRPANVPFSIVESIVGFRFDLGQGYQYGYADIAGTMIYGLRYETTPGVGVDIAPIRGDGAPAGAVPEPATWSLLIAGFGLTGLFMRRRQPRAVA